MNGDAGGFSRLYHQFIKIRQAVVVAPEDAIVER